MQTCDPDADQLICNNSKNICAARKPCKKHIYYLLLGYIGKEVAYYSKGISWEDGIEVRVARAVKADETAQLYREKRRELLIIETMEEFELWVNHWRCAALVEISVWEKYID